jgi:hypothetical protein
MIMRKTTMLASICVLSIAALIAYARQDSSGSKQGRLIVHEWGTFTNFSGSDGVQMDFRPLVDNDLPPFVLDRARQSQVFYPTVFAKGMYLARQRMETPVTYFYTDTPREVDVQVAFPQGLLTEFFPPVSQMAPAYNGSAEDLNSSYLRWSQVRLIPDPAISLDPPTRDNDAVKLPQVAAGNPYAHARETDSAIVQVTSPLGKFYEKFLFYRGLGNFALPVHLTAQGEGKYTVHNRGTEKITALFLVSIRDKQVRFAQAGTLAADAELKLAEPTAESNVDALGAAMVKSLVAAGLYEKEALAMVNTWRASWFGEEGTRVLYLVPPQLTDAILPLDVKPAPQEMVRVLVGRMEILTPEQENLFAELLEKVSDPKAVNETLAAELKKLGRFAEPTLQRIGRTTSDPTVRQRAKELKELLSAAP